MTGAEIERVRKELGLTQAQFGSLLGAHAVTVSRWESDLLHPTPYQLGLLQRFHRATIRTRGKGRRMGDEIAVALVTAGAIAAVYLLLRRAFEDSNQDELSAEPLMPIDGENEIGSENETERPSRGGRRRQKQG